MENLTEIRNDVEGEGWIEWKQRTIYGLVSSILKAQIQMIKYNNYSQITSSSRRRRFGGCDNGFTPDFRLCNFSNRIISR